MPRLVPATVASALNKEAPVDDRRFFSRVVGLDGANLVRLRALWALRGFEFHPLPFVQ
jgi:hypothetical protein